MKKCKTCGENLDISCFRESPKNIDGHRGSCKDCENAYTRRRRMNNPKVREHDRYRDKENEQRRLAKIKETKEWKKRNVYKTSAHKAVLRSVKSGKIIKTPCVVCGSTFRIHGHHEDYSKPLEVIWLCPLHHSRHHAGTIDATKYLTTKEN